MISASTASRVGRPLARADDPGPLRACGRAVVGFNSNRSLDPDRRKAHHIVRAGSDTDLYCVESIEYLPADFVFQRAYLVRAA